MTASSGKRLALFAVQCVMTLGILAWVFHDDQRREAIWRAVGEAMPGWLLAGLLISGVGEVASFIRWGLCLRVLNIRIRWSHVARLFFIGQFFNLFVLGAAGGDAVKSYYVVSDTGSTTLPGVLSVVMDRLISLVTLMMTALAVILWRYDYLTQTPVTMGLLYFLIGFLVCAASMVFFGALTAGWLVHKLPVRLPGRQMLIRVAEAMGLFRRAWKTSLLALTASEMSLLFFFVTFYCTASAFQVDVSLLDMCSIMPIVTVITALPISINGLGVREELFQTLLGDLSDVPAELAVLASLSGFVLFLCWSLVGAGAFLTHRKPLPDQAQPPNGRSPTISASEAATPPATAATMPATPPDAAASKAAGRADGATSSGSPPGGKSTRQPPHRFASLPEDPPMPAT